MKLTNISLAILVAVGVAACGGSDDNNSNKPNDNKPTPTPTPTPDNSNKPVDPERKAPDMTVQDAVKQHVSAAKTTYAAAGARDILTGYAPDSGIVGSAGRASTVGDPAPLYARKLAADFATGGNTDPLLNDGSLYADDATDAANVKRLAETSKDGKEVNNNAINYAATGQLRKDATNPQYNGAVLANPGFTYALGKDGYYYRMKPVDDNGNDIKWHETTPTTRYVPVGGNGALPAVTAAPAVPADPATGQEALSAVTAQAAVAATPNIKDPKEQFTGGFVNQDKLVFLPNVTRVNQTAPGTTRTYRYTGADGLQHNGVRSQNSGLHVQNTSGGANIDGTPGGVDRINSKDYTKGTSPSSPYATRANVNSESHTATDAYAGDLVNGQKIQPFTVENGEVIFRTANFLNKAYNLETADAIQKVDLNDIPLNKSEIQYLPVTINYDVKDTKGTNVMADDSITRKTANVGAMKAYNLPYSLAFVTVNQKGAEKKRLTDGAAARNLFDYASTGRLGDLGAFQVVGYQAPYLPRNGRADYTGKSFGVDSQGDVKLRADFGATGAHIGGSIVNRTYADGQGTLPEITLANIQLSAPGGSLNTTGTTLFGNIAQTGEARSRSHEGKWDVQLFGPDANEAGGVVQFFGTDRSGNLVSDDAVIPGGVEVFTTQRGEITKDSNIAPTP